jgi:hypothetical protein
VLKPSAIRILVCSAAIAALLPSTAVALITVGALDTRQLFASDLEVVGDVAYVTGGSPGLRVIDISDPAFPVKLGTVYTPYSAAAIKVVGDFAYVAARGDGLRVIDVSNPESP